MEHSRRLTKKPNNVEKFLNDVLMITIHTAIVAVTYSLSKMQAISFVTIKAHRARKHLDIRFSHL